MAIAAKALAVALQMNDPTPGSRVALCAANSLEYLISVLAVLEAGKILVPLSCESTTDQLHQLLNDTHPTVIIVDDKGDRLIHSDHELKINFRSEEHTSELQSLMRISYAVFCLKKKKKKENVMTYRIH